MYSSSDTIVIPKQSPWFNFYNFTGDGSDSQVIDMKDTPGYKGDWIGLKTLNEAGKIDRVAFPCKHQDLPRAVCKPYYTKYVKPLLNNK